MKKAFVFDCYEIKIADLLPLLLQEQRCDRTTKDSFLFEEERVGKLHQYKHRDINGTMHLGVPENCDKNLSLIRTTKLDRRCSFKKLKKRTSKNG